MSADGALDAHTGEAGRSPTGNKMVKVVPFPTLLSTPILPPWREIIP
jgi:hypothetical protein